MRKMFRQGDVLVVEVEAPPEKVEAIKGKLDKMDKEDGRVVLAHGEVTGHHHAFDPASSRHVNLFREQGTGTGTLYSKFGLEDLDMPLGGGGMAATERLAELGGAQPRHGVDSIPRARDSSINPNQRRFIEVTGETALLTHDEHATIEVPKGFYEVVIQREYSPSQIRRVED
jgi:hypothetical protein